MPARDAARIPSFAEEVDGGIPLPEYEKNLGTLLRLRAAIEPARTAVRARDASGRWADLSWATLDARRRSIAAGLHECGVRRGHRVAVLSPNSIEMLLAEAALWTLGAASVPIFPDYSPEHLQQCLIDCDARLVLCGSAVQQHRLSSLGPQPQIERVVVLDGQPLPGDDKAAALSSVEALGGRAKIDVEALADAVEPDDVALVLYTSGTTGRPRGVELTHRGAASQQAAVRAVWQIGPSDVFLSFLPWHHCYGALFERLMALSNRALLVLDDSRGRDLDRWLSNLREVRPTVYFGVPRVYQAWAARAQRDPQVLQALLHPKLRFCFSAAAPLPQSCYRLFEEHGVKLHEGWGQTEVTTSATLSRDAHTPGHCGWPMPGTQVKLIPSEAADSIDVGELCVRGPQVMRGYQRAPEATARVMLPGGWLRTGDLGRWTAHGLQLLGRADGVFKLQNGEKVPSAQVEARLLAASPLLEQAVVFGAGQPQVVALAFLNEGAARAWALAHDLGDLPFAELARQPELRLSIAQAVQSANLLAKVPYERVARVGLCQEPLVPAAELTPSQKVIRAAVLARHKDLTEALQRGEPHPAVLDVGRPIDPFQHA